MTWWPLDPCTASSGQPSTWSLSVWWCSPPSTSTTSSSRRRTSPAQLRSSGRDVTFSQPGPSLCLSDLPSLTLNPTYQTKPDPDNADHLDRLQPVRHQHPAALHQHWDQAADNFGNWPVCSHLWITGNPVCFPSSCLSSKMLSLVVTWCDSLFSTSNIVYHLFIYSYVYCTYL